MTSFFLFLQLALPYLALTAGLAALIRGHWRQTGGAARLRLHALMATAVVSHAFLAWGFWAIFSSTSSTASIGLLFLPLYSVGVAAITFPIAWSAFTCAALFASMRRCFGWPAPPLWPHLPVAAAVVVAAVAGATWGTSRYLLLREAGLPATSVARLEVIASDAVTANDVDMLARVARNEAADQAILEQIFDHCLSVGPIDGQAPCYQVFAYIAANKAAPLTILTALADAHDTSILVMVGNNLNTPPTALERLARNPDSFIRGWVAENPGLPLPALAALVDDPDALTRQRAREALRRRTGKASSP